MRFIVDMPDELIPQKQEIVSIDLYFMDGKLCGCTYPFEELKADDDCISRQAAIAVADYADSTGLAIEDVKKVTDEIVKGLKQLPPVTPVQEFIFAKWVAEEIFDENWEYNKDAFEELACRKLAKLGIVRAKGDEWELVKPQESEVNDEDSD